MNARRVIALALSCLLLSLAGCRRPAADAAELTAGDPTATTTTTVTATPREEWQARIATPEGNRALSELVIGERIWSQTADGRRVAVPILEVVSVPAPPGHRLLELVLEDGRVLRASPTHPAADGVPLETFSVGEPLDGSRVVEARLLPEPVPATHDVLPAGETGIYWADGVRLRSTIPAIPVHARN